MFKATQVINKKSNTNRVMCDNEGEIAGNTSKKIEYITDRLKKKNNPAKTMKIRFRK